MPITFNIFASYFIHNNQYLHPLIFKLSVLYTTKPFLNPWYSIWDSGRNSSSPGSDSCWLSVVPLRRCSTHGESLGFLHRQSLSTRLVFSFSILLNYSLSAFLYQSPILLSVSWSFCCLPFLLHFLILMTSSLVDFHQPLESTAQYEFYFFLHVPPYVCSGFHISTKSLIVCLSRWSHSPCPFVLISPSTWPSNIYWPVYPSETSSSKALQRSAPRRLCSFHLLPGSCCLGSFALDLAAAMSLRPLEGLLHVPKMISEELRLLSNSLWRSCLIMLLPASVKALDGFSPRHLVPSFKIF